VPRTSNRPTPAIRCHNRVRSWVEIELTKGQFAKVDLDDLDKVMFDCWSLGGDGYAVRGAPKNKLFRMHRVILGLPADDSRQVDHRNRDRLDNRRWNLRIATRPQNQVNKEKRAGTSSRFKGVSWHKLTGKWVAKLRVDGRDQHLGLFTDEVEAARAHDRAALTAWGEFAYINGV
jgi:hypothetical protein